MNDSTIKRLAGLNGKAIKKTVSMTKTLTAGDDNATVELVQQLGSVVGEMADVLKRHEGIATSQAGMPVSCAVPKEIPENVILDKIAAVATADYDVHKVIRNNGCVTAYFEPTACSNAVESDIDACKKIVADAGMQSVNARLVDDGMAIAVTLVQDAYGNPLLDASGDDEEFEDDDVGDIEGDKVDHAFIQHLLENGVTPVFCALTHDGNGNMLNTNADSVASSVAIAAARFAPTQLVFCFEKDGVLVDIDDPDSLIETINQATFDDLKAKGIIAAGMVPKVTGALKAVSQGVTEVVIKNSANISNNRGTTIK